MEFNQENENIGREILEKFESGAYLVKKEDKDQDFQSFIDDFAGFIKSNGFSKGFVPGSSNTYSSMISHVDGLISQIQNKCSNKVQIAPHNENLFLVLNVSLKFLKGYAGNNELERKYSKLKTAYDKVLNQSCQQDTMNSLDESLTLANEKTKRENLSLQNELKRLQDQNQEFRAIIGNLKSNNDSQLGRANELTSFLISHYNLPTDTGLDTVLSALKKRIQNDVIKEIQVENIQIHQGMQLQLETITKELIESQKKNQDLFIENNSLQINIQRIQQEKEIIKSQLDEKERLLRDYRPQVDYPNVSNEPINTKQFVLETDLQVQQLKNQELQESVSKKRSKIRKLQNQCQSLSEDNRRKDSQIQSLLLENGELKMNNDDFSSKLMDESEITILSEENSLKDKQIERLNVALNELSAQFIKTTEDLGNENMSKNKLISLVQKLSSTLVSCESNTMLLSSELSDVKSRLSKSCELYNELLSKYKDNSVNPHKILEEINGFIESNYSKSVLTDQIQRIFLDPSLSITGRVCESFRVLLQHIEDLSKSQESNQFLGSNLSRENQRLQFYLRNIIRFVNQTLNSQEIQEWLFAEVHPKEFIQQIQSNCSRIESFLKTNCLEDESYPINETYAHFPSLSESILSDIQNDSRKSVDELLSLIGTFALSNEIMIKFSNELQAKCRIYFDELQKAQSQIHIVEDSYEERICQEKDFYESEIERIQSEMDSALSKLQIIQNVLRKGSVEENPSSTVIKCINLLNDQKTEIDNDNELTQNEYIQNLERQLENMNDEINLNNDKLAKLSDKHNKVKASLKSEIRILQDALEASEMNHLAIIEDHQEKLNEITKLKDTFQLENNKLLKEVSILKEKIEKQNSAIEEIQEEHDKTMSLHIKQFEDKLMENETKQKEEADKISEIIRKERNEKRELEISFKSEIKKLQGEIEIQNQRATEIRDHYEQINADLRTKLSEARQTEAESKTLYNQISSEMKDYKSQISSLRVDNKMLQMKITTLEEKHKREKSLMENQFQMKAMNIETDFSAKYEEIKNLANKSHQAFLIRIWEIFSDMIDYNQQINDMNAIELLERFHSGLLSMYKSNAQIDQLKNQCSFIQKLLNVESIEQSIPAIEKLIQCAKENENNYVKVSETRKSIIASSDATLREWEEWGRRVYSLITDSFSISKKSSELRGILEEALLSSISQRQITKRISMLRDEKKLLILHPSILHKSIKPYKRQSLTSIIAVFTSIHRLQKQSGHLKCMISLPSFEQQKKEESIPAFSGKKKWPILSIA